MPEVTILSSERVWFGDIPRGVSASTITRSGNEPQLHFALIGILNPKDPCEGEIAAELAVIEQQRSFIQNGNSHLKDGIWSSAQQLASLLEAPERGGEEVKKFLDLPFARLIQHNALAILYYKYSEKN